MSRTSHNSGTREKLPICERMVALADDLNLPLGNERRLELREDAETIEALVEALEGCESYFEVLEETGDEKHPAMLKLIRTPLSRARNGGQP